MMTRLQKGKCNQSETTAVVVRAYRVAPEVCDVEGRLSVAVASLEISTRCSQGSYDRCRPILQSRCKMREQGVGVRLLLQPGCAHCNLH